MSTFKVNWRKKGYEVIAYSGNRETKRDIVYRNLIDKDPNKIAQVLLDLEIVDSFPILKAVKIYLEKRESKDWMGL